MVPCVVDAVTIRRVLFVCDVSMLKRVRKCDGDRNAGVCGCHEVMGGTRDSGILSRAYYVLEMSVMCGLRGYGGLGSGYGRVEWCCVSGLFFVDGRSNYM